MSNTLRRKPIPKKIRYEVYEKCNHRCAYCGCEITYKQMQVDHITPYDYSKEDYSNRVENLLPTCRSCNYYKHDYSLERFRHTLHTMWNKIYTRIPNVQIAYRFNIIGHVSDEIIFYFEKLNICVGYSFNTYINLKDDKKDETNIDKYLKYLEKYYEINVVDKKYDERFKEWNLSLTLTIKEHKEFNIEEMIVDNGNNRKDSTINI